jgi:hypothetical protein
MVYADTCQTRIRNTIISPACFPHLPNIFGHRKIASLPCPTTQAPVHTWASCDAKEATLCDLLCCDQATSWCHWVCCLRVCQHGLQLLRTRPLLGTRCHTHLGHGCVANSAMPIISHESFRLKHTEYRQLCCRVSDQCCSVTSTAVEKAACTLVHKMPTISLDSDGLINSAGSRDSMLFQFTCRSRPGSTSSLARTVRFFSSTSKKLRWEKLSPEMIKWRCCET